MAPLEKLERDVATTLGIEGVDGHIDNVKIVDECKALRRMSDLNSLDELNGLRRKKAEFLSAAGEAILRNPETPSPTKFTTHTPAAFFSVPGTKIWAVVIGVNKYLDSRATNLNGCVNDARDIHKWLTADLQTPLNQIKLLVDDDTDQTTQPTRHNILKALYDLRDNTTIRRDDNIFIFFAGHGSLYKPCDYFKTEIGRKGTIEAICPMDRYTPDADDSNIPDISDRQINVILSEIREARSPNITVVLDCCYAAGITRSSELDYIQRSATSDAGTLETMLLAADKDYRKRPESQSVCAEDYVPDMSSNVTLMACADFETAKEMLHPVPHGIFTEGFLHAVKSRQWCDATYDDLVKKGIASLWFQTPGVVGTRSHEKIWFPNETGHG